MKLRGKEGLSRMHKTMFNSASYMQDLSLPEFTQILELVFEDENCSFMNKNFCNQGRSVFFLTFLGTDERKVASLASEAFDTGLQVKNDQL